MDDNTTSLSNILNLDPADPKSSDMVFEYLNQNLSDISEKKFLPSTIIPIKGIALKYYDCLERISFGINKMKDDFFARLEEFIRSCQKYNEYVEPTGLRKLLLRNREHYHLNNCEREHSEFHSFVMELYSEAIKYRPTDYHFELSGLYRPDQSNKTLIQSLIKEAFELIEKDTTLSEKARNSMLKHLESILSELASSKTNWTISLGKIREAIIILGAIGSMTGGITSLMQAEEKMKNATVVIQSTSISLNYKTIDEIFADTSSLNLKSIPMPKSILGIDGLNTAQLPEGE